MKNQISSLLARLLVALTSVLTIGEAAAAPPVTSTEAVAPDNTKSNKQDATNRNPTADDQSNNASDLKITQQIRRSVLDDKSLSTYGHNAKIVSVNGMVTLNGVVQTEAEKVSIAAKAAQVVGADHVVNKLEIGPRK
jgi:osmotically-inducible protein OsmY